MATAKAVGGSGGYKVSGSPESGEADWPTRNPGSCLVPRQPLLQRSYAVAAAVSIDHSTNEQPLDSTVDQCYAILFRRYFFRYLPFSVVIT